MRTGGVLASGLAVLAHVGDEPRGIKPPAMAGMSTTPRSRRPRPKAYRTTLFLEAGLIVAWSSGFIGARLAADTPSIYLVLFWRFVAVAVLVAPFVLWAWCQGVGYRSIGVQVTLGTLAMFGYLALGVAAIDRGVPLGTAALLFAPLAVLEGGLSPQLDPQFLASVAWFVLFSTVLAYGLYWLCLRRSTATRVGSLIYLTPPVTMVWAWAMFGEALSPVALIGFAICLLGVGLAR